MMYLPADSRGGVGAATRASAERGRAIYEFIRGRIAERVLGRAPAAAEVAP
jgi:hypothetical protein